MSVQGHSRLFKDKTGKVGYRNNVCVCEITAFCAYYAYRHFNIMQSVARFLCDSWALYLMASNISDVGLSNSSSADRRRSTTQRDAVGGLERVDHVPCVWWSVADCTLAEIRRRDRRGRWWTPAGRGWRPADDQQCDDPVWRLVRVWSKQRRRTSAASYRHRRRLRYVRQLKMHCKFAVNTEVYSHKDVEGVQIQQQLSFLSRIPFHHNRGVASVSQSSRFTQHTFSI